MTDTQLPTTVLLPPVVLRGQADLQEDPSQGATWVELNPGLAADEHVTEYANSQVQTYVFGYVGDKPQLGKQLGIPTADFGNDAETVAQLYLKFGTTFLANLAGNWAVVILDRANQKAILARDQAGTRPLFYSAGTTSVEFSTSIEALTPSNEPPTDLDLAAVNEHLARGFVSNRATLQMAIRPIPPAHMLEVSADGLSLRRYWEPSNIPLRADVEFDHAALELRHLLESVIAEISDQPHGIGAHMSGGLDTTAIIATTAKSRPHESIPTYSWQPRPVAGNTWDIDGTLVQLVSDTFSVRASYLPTADEDMAEFLAIDPVTSPATSTLMTELPVMKRAQAEGIALIVSGWGGDDFVSSRAPRLRHGFSRHLVNLKRRVTRVDAPKDSRQRMLECLNRGHLVERTDSWSVHGARFGVQYAYPLLDRRLIEFALSLPNNLFIDRQLMREALKGIVPEEIRTNTDKSDMWRSRHSWELLESVREVGLALPVVPERVPLIDNVMFARYLSQSRLDIDRISADSSDFLTTLQFVYNPAGQPYSDCVEVDLQSLASHDLASDADAPGTRHRARVLAQATIAVVIADLAVRFLRFSRIARTLGVPQATDRQRAPSQAELRTATEIGKAVERVSNRLPHRPLCLPQSVATHHLLARCGIPSTLKLGVKMNPSSETDAMAAHSWVAVDGKIVNGRKDYRQYTVTNTFTLR